MVRLLFFAGLIAVLAQTTLAQTVSNVQILTATRPTSGSLPEHELFRHFLKWVSKLDEQSRGAGGNDPDAFAAPFAKKLNMSHQDLELLRREAAGLEADLAVQDGKVVPISSSYRLQVRAALDAGAPLPPIPPELRRLSSQRAEIQMRQAMDRSRNHHSCAVRRWRRRIDNRILRWKNRKAQGR